MCGIFGFLLNRPLTPDDVEFGRRGTEMLVHRGPDGGGHWVDAGKGVFLGNRRLAIIDLSEASAQPFVGEGGVLTYNGEIYNFVELRRDLEALGHRFETSGDTEVLFEAWREWGEAALDRFDGMFAFALYDGARLHIATDPFGEKPLHWAQTANGVYFSSEAQVLTELLGLRFAPTDEEVAAFMALGFLPAPATGFRGLEALPPATHMVFSAAGPASSRRYWRPPPAASGRGRLRPLSEKELDRIQAVLAASLERRLRADTPLGLFLSGGIDSSTVAAILAKDLKRDLTAYTVAFPDGADESGAAARIARYLGLRHEIIDSRRDDGWRQAPALLASLYGTPNDNLTAISVQQMSALARRHITVALSGLGGDEMFYGYGKYAFLYRRRTAYRLLPPLVNALRPFDPVLKRIGAWNTATQLLRGDRSRQFLSLKNSGLGEELMALPGARAWARGLLPNARAEIALAVRDFDMLNTLPGSYIPAVDRGSMRASLEVRTPYLSRDLAETLAEFDQRAFLAFGQKSVLRRILYRYVPPDLVEPRKQGFVFPAERYLALQPDAPPRAPIVPPETRARIWNRRCDGRYRSLAMRLAILAAFAEPAGQ